MLRMTNLMCCSEDVYEDPHEIELLKEVNHEANPSLDGSNHWKADSSSLGGDSVVEVPFIFGGSASTWLCPESIQLSDANPDSILACDIEDDGAVYDESVGQPSASSESCQAKDPMEVTSSSAQSYSAELEIEAMIESPTDPVGKFLRQHGITGRQAVALNIHELLLNAPKTPRQKYGPRQEQSAAQRMQQCKDRNRAHAKATRQRKKLYEQILQVLENHSTSGTGAGRANNGSEDGDDAMSDTTAADR